MQMEHGAKLQNTNRTRTFFLFYFSVKVFVFSFIAQVPKKAVLQTQKCYIVSYKIVPRDFFSSNGSVERVAPEFKLQKQIKSEVYNILSVSVKMLIFDISPHNSKNSLCLKRKKLLQYAPERLAGDGVVFNFRTVHGATVRAKLRVQIDVGGSRRQIVDPNGESVLANLIVRIRVRVIGVVVGVAMISLVFVVTCMNSKICHLYSFVSVCDHT